MKRKPPRQNPIRDFVKEAHKQGLDPVIVTAVLPDGTIKTEMRTLAASTQQVDKDVNEWDAVQ